MSTSKIKAVAFDLFGTLLEIRRPHNPYGRVLDALQLSVEERAQARRRLMCTIVGLAGIGPLLDQSVPKDVLIEAEESLYDELTSVRLFNDTWETLHKLRVNGIKIAIASNLAYPYSVPVCLLLPFEPDVCAWSFGVGAVKPDPLFFDYMCQNLGCVPDEVLMVGDTRRNDYEGAKAAGLRALHLDRSQAAKGDRIQFLQEAVGVVLDDALGERDPR